MLSEKLKEARAELGLTQKQMGELLGIASNTIARYERNEMQAQHPQVLDMAVDLLRIKLTPTVKKKLALLEMSRADLEKYVAATGK